MPMSLAIALGIGTTPSPPSFAPPEGFKFLINTDGDYLINTGGDYLIVESE